MTKQPIEHLSALTGLRFAAAMLVFIHHTSALSELGVTVVRFSLGAIGVSFFFVLSGFIMCHVYDDRLKPSGFPRYWLTRFARIWPLHAVCLFVFVTMFESWNHLVQTPGEGVKFAVNALLLQSWMLTQDWVLAFNGPAWSLSTEMAFYAIFPFLILVPKRRFPVIILMIGLATLIALGALDWCLLNRVLPAWLDVAKWPQGLPLFRVFEFVCGMGAARLFAARRRVSRGTSPPWRDSLHEVLALTLVIGFILM
ncbi:MAG: acyltransferase, partial [Verrucomicrobia bacterium]|nr:acyltransferase [Verrucomicrobiota bacterium]